MVSVPAVVAVAVAVQNSSAPPVFPTVTIQQAQLQNLPFHIKSCSIAPWIDTGHQNSYRLEGLLPYKSNSCYTNVNQMTQNLQM